MRNMRNSKFTEPDDYIPKEIRKELKLGEFAEDEKEKEDKKLNKEFRDYVNNK